MPSNKRFFGGLLGADPLRTGGTNPDGTARSIPNEGVMPLDTAGPESSVASTTIVAPDYSTDTQTKITASDAAASDNYGKSTAISGDSSIYAVGATGGNAVYVYEGGSEFILTAPSTDYFGTSIAISKDGTTLVVSDDFYDLTNYPDAGGLFIYERPSGGWATTSTPTATLASIEYDHLGRSVDISDDGSVVVASNGGGGTVGDVIVYEKPSGGWANATDGDAELSSPGAGSFATGQKDNSVAISGDGTVIAAGANSEDTGSTNSGSVFIYNKPSSGGWATTSSATHELGANPRVSGDSFGWSVSLDEAGTSLAVGTQDYSSNAGAVYLLENSGGTWSQSAILTGSGGQSTNIKLGTTAKISRNGRVVVSGAEYDTTTGGVEGAVFLWHRPSGGWTSSTHDEVFLASDAAVSDYFGCDSLSIDTLGNNFLAGAYRNDDGGSASGSAYLITAGTPGTTTENILLSPQTFWGGMRGRSILTPSVAAVAGDSNWDDVVLLLDGSSFTDSSTASPTVTTVTYGGLPTSGNSGGKFGSYMEFSPFSDRINVTLEESLGASGESFTIECWVNPDAMGNDGVWTLGPNLLGSTNLTLNNSLAVALYNNKWTVYYDGANINSLGSPSTGTWHHTAFVFDGTDMRFYVDGSLLDTEANSANHIPSGGYDYLSIGGYYNTGFMLDGKLEDFRVTKGVARYTGNSYTVPTASFPKATSVAGVVSGIKRSGVLSISEDYQARYEKVLGNLVASGGNNTFTDTDGVYRYHEFTSSGTLNVTSGGTFDVLLVGGGGGGGSSNAGGGGGGEVIIGTGLFLSDANAITVTVGAGGAGASSGSSGSNGGVSSISATDLTSIIAKQGRGGDGRGSTLNSDTAASNGGGRGDIGTSSSASYNNAQTNQTGISSYSSSDNDGTYSIFGGNDGGAGWNLGFAGGGGGAGANGDGGRGPTGADTSKYFSDGGPGVQVTGWGTSTDYYYGGGGGGSTWSGQSTANGGDGGLGGGGGGAATNTSGVSTSGDGDTNGRNNGIDGQSSTSSASSATGGDAGANTGGGGGAGAYSLGTGGDGGSGIVVIRYQI